MMRYYPKGKVQSGWSKVPLITVNAETVHGGDYIAKFLSANGTVTISVVERENPSQFIRHGTAWQRRQSYYKFLHQAVNKNSSILSSPRPAPTSLGPIQFLFINILLNPVFFLNYNIVANICEKRSVWSFIKM